MQSLNPKVAVAADKVDPDYKFDEKMLVSKQRKLDILLQKCDIDKTTIDYQVIKFRNVQYEIGFFVELWDLSLKRPHIGKIARIVQLPFHLEKLPFIQVQWCLKGQNLPEAILTPYGKHISIAEVFLSEITMCLSVEAIKRRCYVISVEEYGAKSAASDDYYFSRSSYDQQTQQLVPSPKYWRRMCFCDAPQNPDLQYVLCGKCEKWYHVDCVTIDKPEQTFYCNRCNRQFASQNSFAIE